MTLPTTPSFRLDGKRALVAGASSGIGLACAVALGEAGANVTLAARTSDKLADAVSQMRAAGMTAEALTLDVADVGATAQAVASAGPFDVLVNSAGSARHSPSVDTMPEDFDAVQALNFTGA